MGNLLENLKKYFENTPQDVLDKDWKDVEYLNEIGPDVIEYAEYIHEYYGNAVQYLCSENELETHRFDLPEFFNKDGIAADSQYCFAA